MQIILREIVSLFFLFCNAGFLIFQCLGYATGFLEGEVVVSDCRLRWGGSPCLGVERGAAARWGEMWVTLLCATFFLFFFLTVGEPPDRLSLFVFAPNYLSVAPSPPPFVLSLQKWASFSFFSLFFFFSRTLKPL